MSDMNYSDATAFHANGSIMANGNGSNSVKRKVSTSQLQPPSKVLHVRGLPAYTSEADLLSFFSTIPGANLTRILLLPNSNQAFIQLPSVEAAAALLQQQMNQGGSFVKGNKTIVLQYSSRQEIHTPNTNGASQPLPTTAASSSTSTNQFQQSHHSQQQQLHQSGLNHSSNLPSTHHQHQQQQHPQHSSGNLTHHPGQDSQQQPNSILIVTVLNTRVPVTLDHIHTIFKPYGDVLKIISFHKNGVFKALVQLGSVESAVNARMLLDRCDIFQGCCHLRIGFSSLQELSVKTPGNNARDFTSPSGATPSFGNQEGGTAGAGAYSHSTNTGGAPYQQAGLISNGAYSNGYTAPHHTSDSGYSASSQAHHTSVPPPPPHPQTPGCVVLVSNLPESRVNCDVLFTLFGVYGDVRRVKILYNRRDTALVQFVSPQSAYLAALHLNHLNLYGKQISVTPSKHVEVSLPKVTAGGGGTQAEQEQAMSGLTQDYTHSPIHRFKRSSGAAAATSPQGGLGIHAKSIHPPSQVLHVSSLSDAVTEEELRLLFSSLPLHRSTGTAAANGEKPSDEQEEKVAQTPPVVQFFTSTTKPTGPMPPSSAAAAQAKVSKQAFLRFDSVSKAVENLIEFHNYSLHGRYLRISFSGKDPAQVHETLNGQPLHPQQTNQNNNNAATQAASSSSGNTNSEGQATQQD